METFRWAYSMTVSYSAMLGALVAGFTFIGAVYVDPIVALSHRLRHGFAPLSRANGHTLGRVFTTIAPIPVAGLFLLAATADFDIAHGFVIGLTSYAAFLLANRLTMSAGYTARDFAMYVWPYVAAILRHLVGFLITYLALAICFAHAYEVIYENDPTAFAGMPANTAAGFLFYSVTTITSVGISQVRPVSGLAELASSIELLLGVVLVVGVLGVVFAQAGPLMQSVRAPSTVNCE